MLVPPYQAQVHDLIIRKNNNSNEIVVFLSITVWKSSAIMNIVDLKNKKQNTHVYPFPHRPAQTSFSNDSINMTQSSLHNLILL